MRWVRLAFGVLIALVMVASPSIAFAESLDGTVTGPTREEIEEGQRFEPTEEQMRDGADPSVIGWNNIVNCIRPLTQQFAKVGTDYGLVYTVEVLAGGALVAIGLVFTWWGVRKVSKVLFAAFRKGRFSA